MDPDRLFTEPKAETLQQVMQEVDVIVITGAELEQMLNDLAAQNKNRQPKYHYFRDAAHRPMITIAAVWDNYGQHHLGYAICSPTDNPDKRIGRKLAEKRARAAMWQGLPMWTRPIRRPEAVEIINACIPDMAEQFIFVSQQPQEVR